MCALSAVSIAGSTCVSSFFLSILRVARARLHSSTSLQRLEYAGVHLALNLEARSPPPLKSIFTPSLTLEIQPPLNGLAWIHKIQFICHFLILISHSFILIFQSSISRPISRNTTTNHTLCKPVTATSRSAKLSAVQHFQQSNIISLNMPSIRAQSGLRRLRTVFTPSSQGLSPVSEEKMPNTYTASRLSTDDSCCSFSASHSPLRSSMSGRFSQLASSFSSHSLNSMRAKFAIRRSPSQIELEQEEERLMCGDELLGLIEPRPCAPSAVGSFEDVLFGRL